MTSDRRVVVIGVGPAGVRLARRPARPGRSGTPAPLIGAEDHPTYQPVRPAEVPAGRYAPEATALPAPGHPMRTRGTGRDRAAGTVGRGDGPPAGHTPKTGLAVVAVGVRPRPARSRRGRRVACRSGHRPLHRNPCAAPADPATGPFPLLTHDGGS
ncbi:hypothetical protein GQF42_15370 [Streptomyces broussonetiae]|uniref:FAD/NAD(P)-binding domain-containing protein n=1 Tax=Streptomyces broussonetiae TaxID=2686304 RepID=A0A6I6N375_9ACTN|nr:hypothetical protein GQF42_15370 [Streptomyces broussonetiae]